MTTKEMLEKHFKSKKELLKFYRKNKDIEIYQLIEETPKEYVVSMKHCLKPTLIKKDKTSYTIKYCKRNS